ncbi:MAG: hypothetical protein IVW53_00585 [Chloroflexi bacterium]|nr:hypothetical protein [Chloroflexota bacterium]
MSEERVAAEVRYGEWYPDPRRRRTAFRLRHLSCPYCRRIVGRQGASTQGNPPLVPAELTLDVDLSLDMAQSAQRGRPVYERPASALGTAPRPRPRRELVPIPQPDGTARIVWRPSGPHPGETETDASGRMIWFREPARGPCEVRCACRAWLRISGRRPGDPAPDSLLPKATPATFIVVMDRARPRRRSRSRSS